MALDGKVVSMAYTAITRALSGFFGALLIFGFGTTDKILGVYEAVDPGIYSIIYPDNPHPRTKEVVNLLIEWYQLLIDMRYINAESVAFAPHQHLRINLSEAAKFGLARDVVDLWQMMPYHISSPNWNFGSDGGEFLMWGEFMDDMRGSEAQWWHNVGDPFYAISTLSPEADPKRRAKDADERGWDHKEGPYMRPWYATLTNCGNHGSIMVLDTKTCVSPAYDRSSCGEGVCLRLIR